MLWSIEFLASTRLSGVSHLLAAKVWTYWISIPLFVGALVMIVALIIGYLVKVVSAKYPKQ